MSRENASRAEFQYNMRMRSLCSHSQFNDVTRYSTDFSDQKKLSAKRAAARSELTTDTKRNKKVIICYSKTVQTEKVHTSAQEIQTETNNVEQVCVICKHCGFTGKYSLSPTEITLLLFKICIRNNIYVLLHGARCLGNIVCCFLQSYCLLTTAY
jgi:hypothetical protein